MQHATKNGVFNEILLHVIEKILGQKTKMPRLEKNAAIMDSYVIMTLSLIITENNYMQNNIKQHKPHKNSFTPCSFRSLWACMRESEMLSEQFVNLKRCRPEDKQYCFTVHWGKDVWLKERELKNKWGRF